MKRLERAVRYWDRISSKEIVEVRNNRYACIIIPIGVIEAHGPLLPTGLDVMMASMVAHVVAERIQKHGACPLICNAALYSGVVGATQGFPGTINYPAIHSTENLFIVLRDLVAQGFKRFFLVNGDAGTSKSLIPFLYHATKERWDFFSQHDGAISLFTWFDGIEEVGHASIVEHAFYTYLCEHHDPHIRDIAVRFGMDTPLHEEYLKELDGVERVYPQPRREFASWLSLKGQSEVYGVSYFSYEEYKAFLNSGRVHTIWELQIARIARDILGILDLRGGEM